MGYGNEYFDDYIYKGYYINGQKNGLGYEYYYNYKYGYSNQRLKFEGKYHNDKKISGKEYDIGGHLIYTIEEGKIKEYYEYNKIKFEGEYLNGKRWNGKLYPYYGNEVFELKCGNGEIKDYNKDGICIYEGKYINGQRNGKGISYEKSGIMYVGEFLDGKKNGEGKEYDNIGELIFDGIYFDDNKWSGKSFGYHIDTESFEYKSGLDEPNHDIYYEIEYLKGKKWNGKIKNIDEDKIYEIKNGNGYIKEDCFYLNDMIFEGLYLNGEKNGYGKEYGYVKDGEFKELYLAFEGEFLNGKRWNGKVKELDKNDQLKFEGELLHGKKWKGQAKEYDDSNDLIFEGEYLNGKRWNGKGFEIYCDNKSEYYFEGEYVNGVKNGNLRIYDFSKYPYLNILHFDGQCLNGIKHGKCKEYNKYGGLEFEGQYLNGKKMEKE